MVTVQSRFPWRTAIKMVVMVVVVVAVSAAVAVSTHFSPQYEVELAQVADYISKMVYHFLSSDWV